jgi:hypothetical protein
MTETTQEKARLTSQEARIKHGKTLFIQLIGTLGLAAAAKYTGFSETLVEYGGLPLSSGGMDRTVENIPQLADRALQELVMGTMLFALADNSYSRYKDTH